jgi:hypothetical protein
VPLISNMNITLCARSKILRLLDPGRAFRIQATGTADAGSHVDLIPNTDVTGFDSTISSIPLVVADIQTVTLLAGQSIDFDYTSEEFIISKEK